MSDAITNNTATNSIKILEKRRSAPHAMTKILQEKPKQLIGLNVTSVRTGFTYIALNGQSHGWTSEGRVEYVIRINSFSAVSRSQRLSEFKPTFREPLTAALIPCRFVGLYYANYEQTRQRRPWLSLLFKLEVNFCWFDKITMFWSAG